MSKQNYKAVILIFASNDLNIYKNLRKIWKKYMYLDPSIKVFFVYGKTSEEDKIEDFDNNSDIYFPNIQESVNLQKTVEAMDKIHNEITYEYFIRTNLSTFWDFKKLHNRLIHLPKSNFYSGIKGFCSEIEFVSGTDIIITPDLVEAILKNKHLIDYNITDDVSLALLLNKNLKVPIINYPGRFDIISIHSINENERINQLIKESNQLEKIDHYRVKNEVADRENIDFYFINCY